MIQSAYPDAKRNLAIITVGFENAQDFQSRYGSMEQLAREFVPVLTGLSHQELDDLGYALIEDDTNRTLLVVRPADLVQA